LSRLDPTAGRRGSLRGAWWIAALVGMFFVAVAVLQIGEVLRHRGEVGVGDGKDPATYGYDLSALSIDDRWLAATMPKDNLESLDRPPLLTPHQVDSLNAAERGKYLVPDDRIIGVVVGDEARAYPVRVMNWHEVANDTLGGVAVAVTWHPLSGSAVVLRRDELELSVSGLVWNSHHLLHDREQTESLWVPLLATAVLGPQQGRNLPLIPCALTTWGQWRAAYPHTTAPRPASAMKPAYKRDPYGNYWSGDTVRYPVSGMQESVAGRRLKVGLHEDPIVTTDGLLWARKHGFRFVLEAVARP